VLALPDGRVRRVRVPRRQRLRRQGVEVVVGGDVRSGAGPCGRRVAVARGRLVVSRLRVAAQVTARLAFGWDCGCWSWMHRRQRRRHWGEKLAGEGPAVVSGGIVRRTRPKREFGCGGARLRARAGAAAVIVRESKVALRRGGDADEADGLRGAVAANHELSFLELLKELA